MPSSCFFFFCLLSLLLYRTQPLFPSFFSSSSFTFLQRLLASAPRFALQTPFVLLLPRLSFSLTSSSITRWRSGPDSFFSCCSFVFFFSFFLCSRFSFFFLFFLLLSLILLVVSPIFVFFFFFVLLPSLLFFLLFYRSHVLLFIRPLLAPRSPLFLPLFLPPSFLSTSFDKS